MFKFDDQNLATWTAQGAFLVSKDGIMTASWGFVGVMWGKKIVIVPVRDSRFTKTFIDESGEFTLSVPRAGEMRRELTFCGIKSGRDTDKWAGARLTKKQSRRLTSPVVDGCAKYYECKVLAVLDMKGLDLADFKEWYPDDDRHNFYMGEVVSEY